MRLIRLPALIGLTAAAVLLPHTASADATGKTPLAPAPTSLIGNVTHVNRHGGVTMRFTHGDALGTTTVTGLTATNLQISGQQAAPRQLTVGATLVVGGDWTAAGSFAARTGRALHITTKTRTVTGTISSLDPSLSSVTVHVPGGVTVTGYVQSAPFVAPNGVRPVSFSALRLNEPIRLVGSFDSAQDGQMLVSAAYPAMPTA